MWTWYDAIVTLIEPLSPTVKRFLLEVQDPEPVLFKAGQFITLDLPIHEKRLKRWRSYSIANAPQGGHTLELCVVKMDGGLGSAYLCGDVVKGSVLRFKGPEGVFTLPEAGFAQDVVFVCTGTGIAPFRSMIQHIFRQEIPHRGLHLIYGTRQADNILYRHEMETLAEQHPEFSYSIALSRQPDWTGFQGYVHEVYEKFYPHAAATDTRFYLCGWQMMIDEARRRLANLGAPERNIFFELYG